MNRRRNGGHLTHPDAPAVGVPRRRLRLGVDLDQALLVPPRESAKRTIMADGASTKVVRVVVEEGAVALGRGEELGDGGDAKSLTEGVPHVGSASVAIGLLDVVVLVARRRRDREEVAKDLADVSANRRASAFSPATSHRRLDPLNRVGVVLPDLVPEATGTELPVRRQSRGREKGGKVSGALA